MRNARPPATAITNLLFSFQKYSIGLVERDHELELPPPGLVRRFLVLDRCPHPAGRIRQLVPHRVEGVPGSSPDVLVDLPGQEDHAAERRPADHALLDAVHDVLVAEGIALPRDPDLLLAVGLDLAHDEAAAA